MIMEIRKIRMGYYKYPTNEEKTKWEIIQNPSIDEEGTLSYTKVASINNDVRVYDFNKEKVDFNEFPIEIDDLKEIDDEDLEFIKSITG